MTLAAGACWAQNSPKFEIRLTKYIHFQNQLSFSICISISSCATPKVLYCAHRVRGVLQVTFHGDRRAGSGTGNVISGVGCCCSQPWWWSTNTKKCCKILTRHPKMTSKALCSHWRDSNGILCQQNYPKCRKFQGYHPGFHSVSPFIRCPCDFTSKPAGVSASGCPLSLVFL